MHPTQPIGADVDSLGWLVGRWLGTADEDRLEEIWTDPHGGMMLARLLFPRVYG